MRLKGNAVAILVIGIFSSATVIGSTYDKIRSNIMSSCDKDTGKSSGGAKSSSKGNDKTSGVAQQKNLVTLDQLKSYNKVPKGQYNQLNRHLRGGSRPFDIDDPQIHANDGRLVLNSAETLTFRAFSPHAYFTSTKSSKRSDQARVMVLPKKRYHGISDFIDHASDDEISLYFKELYDSIVKVRSQYRDASGASVPAGYRFLAKHSSLNGNNANMGGDRHLHTHVITGHALPAIFNGKQPKDFDGLRKDISDNIIATMLLPESASSKKTVQLIAYRVPKNYLSSSPVNLTSVRDVIGFTLQGHDLSSLMKNRSDLLVKLFKFMRYVISTHFQALDQEGYAIVTDANDAKLQGFKLKDGPTEAFVAGSTTIFALGDGSYIPTESLIKPS